MRIYEYQLIEVWKIVRPRQRISKSRLAESIFDKWRAGLSPEERAANQSGFQSWLDNAPAAEIADWYINKQK